MNKVIHLETSLKCIFGVLDDDGNVVNRQPVTLEIPKHEEELFKNALEVLQKTKVELQSQLDESNQLLTESNKTEE